MFQGLVDKLITASKASLVLKGSEHLTINNICRIFLEGILQIRLILPCFAFPSMSKHGFSLK